MPPYLFVDTGAWLALADADDRHHMAATQAFSVVAQRRLNLVTTNLVVAEAYAGIRRRLRYGAAVAFLDRIARASRLDRVYSTPELEETAESILRQYADQDFSYTDAVSFAVMRQRAIEEAFTFDQHFVAAGFAAVPGS